MNRGVRSLSLRSRGQRAAMTAAATVIVVAAVTACSPGSIPAGETTSPAPTIDDGPKPAAGGWVSFAADWSTSDISLVRTGEPAHRIVGADGDAIARVCPAFAPDGARLAFGEAKGDRDTEWADAALVISEVAAEGAASVVNRIDLPDLAHPPCPIWSPDGRWVAFGADTAGQRVARVASDVWLVDIETGDIRTLTELAATDIEWAPDGSQLYIAGAAGIRVYSLADARTHTLDGTALSHTLTASPDGQSLAVERRRINAEQRYDLLLMNADGSDQQVLVDDYAQMHSIGPVWAPDGSSVVFPRSCATVTDASGDELPCTEQHDVILVTVEDGDDSGPIGTQRVVPLAQTENGDGEWTWFPYTVSWSPDSQALLYLAWGETEVGSSAGEYTEGVLVVPIDGSSSPEILYETSSWIDVYSGFPRNNFQSWSPQ